MRRIAIHVLFWVGFVIWSAAILDWHNFAVNCDKSFFSNVMHVSWRLPIIAGATYLLMYQVLVTYLFERKSIVLFGVFAIKLFCFASVIDRSVIALVDSGFSINSDGFRCSFFNYPAIIRNALILMAVMGLASMVRFYRFHIKNEEYQHALVQDNLQNQLAFFKAQVSPHFLFNSLNNIYSDCIKKGEQEIASNIEHLSGIMRYLTYYSAADFVPLNQEVELIRDYFEVERMRLAGSSDSLVSFVAEGNFGNYKIAPVLLLPLVENAFKHGVAISDDYFIHVKLNLVGDTLFFETKNTNRRKESDNGGVGLSNVRKRLQMVYPGSHKLEEKSNPDVFELSLRIELTNA